MNKQWWQWALLIGYALINVVAFMLCAYDKRQAKRGGRRISERTLLTISLLFGALGMFIGMRARHHKTQKPRFWIGVPMMLIAQVALLIYTGAFV